MAALDPWVPEDPFASRDPRALGDPGALGDLGTLGDPGEPMGPHNLDIATFPKDLRHTVHRQGLRKSSHRSS